MHHPNRPFRLKPDSHCERLDGQNEQNQGQTKRNSNQHGGDAGGDPPTDPDDGCQAETTYNYYHKTAGRAYSTGNYYTPDYFAQGSDQPMAGSTWGTTELHSTDGGTVWQVGACP